MVAFGPSMHNDTVIIIMWEEKFMIIKGTSKKTKNMLLWKFVALWYDGIDNVSLY